MTDDVLRERLLRLERSLPVAEPPAVRRARVSVRPSSSASLRALVAGGVLALAIVLGVGLVLPSVRFPGSGGAPTAAVPGRPVGLFRSTMPVDDTIPICLAVELDRGATPRAVRGWWWTTDGASCGRASSPPTPQQVSIEELPLTATRALPARTGYRLSFEVQLIPDGSRTIQALLDPAAIDVPQGVWASMKGVAEIPTPPGGGGPEPSGAAATAGPDGCSVTRPDRRFVAPSPYPGTPPARYGSEWFGSERLWTMLRRDGEVWSELPRGPRGLSQKTFWWSADWRPAAEPEPAITVAGMRLDGSGSFVADGGTNATADFGTAMLVGVEFPTPGCWRLTARYRAAELSYVVLIKDD